jgi:trans-aconitate methyltransferase
VWRLLIGGSLYTAPISEPFRILDLGTGTGSWAVDMADEFPSAEVQGVDLSPIQPQWVPPNCKFHVDDYDGDWTYRAHEAFDFIHGRALSGTSGNWAKFYRQVHANLKPGGWVEMQEYDAWIFSDDDSCDRAPWTMDWVQKLDDASKGFGKQINVAQYQKQWMIDAGFVDVKEEVHRVSLESPSFLFPFFVLFFHSTPTSSTTKILSPILIPKCRFQLALGPKTRD